jgi:ABC-type branched-subunit amino acid transport system substrate-binding protein
VVGGSGTGGALPHVGLVERGYKKQIYHNHGTVNREFIKIGGKSVEGAIAPTGPLIVPEELPADNPIKKVAGDFINLYEKTFGDGSRNAFAGYSYDGCRAAGRGKGEAGDAGIPRRAPRCARVGEECGRRAWRLQHERKRPYRSRQSRTRAGASPGRCLAADEIAAPCD